MSHIKKKIGIYSFCVLASSVVLAEGSSVVYATKAKTPENYVSESNISETVKYIDGKGQKSLDPKSAKDIAELANSVEFEVYKFNELAASKTTFVSPAGICSGFKSDDGVDVTNSSSYYMKPNDASEYYGSILGATIYKKGETKHSQYIPIYAIKNANVAKYIKQNEDPNVRKKANERIKEGRETLNKVICDKR
ncbi:MAG: hypothetical protein E7H17_08450 [Haemophilus parainfluenzae]|jgi:hypothetical protein|uniref:hypothetical protein n=1 Tax=uncultured Haemophilus sp. TaxID=237779 RepID=UPI0025DF1C4B|nr:hypothetical protein [uncultured Haemophilus sp.]MDU3949133.1 hypothetical protein [Haemophilus parainfluenzae]MDU5794506.1 hypothetical protein [Haemophilus parainfluenzae]